MHRNGSGGVDDRGAQAVGGVGAAVHIYRSTAPVGADGSGGAAGGRDRQVTGIGNAAAGGHDAAGAVAAGGDHGVGNVHGGAVTGCTVLSAVAAVGKDAVCAACVAGDRSTADGQRCAALGQHGGIEPVEIAAVAAVRVARFGNVRICQCDFLVGIDQDRIFVRAVGEIYSILQRGGGGDLRCGGIGHVGSGAAGITSGSAGATGTTSRTAAGRISSGTLGKGTERQADGNTQRGSCRDDPFVTFHCLSVLSKETRFRLRQYRRFRRRSAGR